MERSVIELHIDAFTPDTLPLGRMAEYLAAYARLLGSSEELRFAGLVKGSATLRVSIPATDSQFVSKRLKSASTADGPEDARKAYAQIDRMLRENGAVGDVRLKGGARIIQFPGRRLPAEPPALEVTEIAEVDGVVVRVGGTDQTIPVHLQGANGEIFPCTVKDRAVARQLAGLLFEEPIRARGMGTWSRGADGRWKLKSMNIDGWDVLDAASPLVLLDQLRAARGNGWLNIADVDTRMHRIREGG